MNVIVIYKWFYFLVGMKVDINRNFIWLCYLVNNKKILLLGIGNFFVLLLFCNNENSVLIIIELV